MEQTLGKQNFQKIIAIGILSLSVSACMAPDTQSNFYEPNPRANMSFGGPTPKHQFQFKPETFVPSPPERPSIVGETPEGLQVNSPFATICDVKKSSVKRGLFTRWSDTIHLPSTGIFYQEGHLATEEDSWKNKNGSSRYFPQSNTDDIESHLERSARMLGVSVEQLYPNKWAKLWTPPEGGRSGQGSVGNLKPSAQEEMFIFNMMFQQADRPPPGERWLMSYGNHHAVVVGGYEIGPASQSRLGGVQPEVLHILKAPYGSAELTIHGPLIDQSLAPGKINCSDVEYVSK